jgi:pimeloyl-ACP methyl ester carboxylesterase
MSTTLVGGRPVRSFTAGESHQVPELVMIPGLGAPGYLVPWAHRIAAWTKVTIVDLPGWRLGRRGSCRATVSDIAAAALDWLAATARDRVILLGHSTGANAALQVAARQPERLTGVVLAGPTFEPAARRTTTLIRRAVTTFAHEVPAELGAVGPSYLASGILPLLRLIRSGQRDRPEDHVGSLTVPSLFVTGSEDGFAPPHWARYLAYLADSPCVVLPGGHNGCYPFPDEFDDALRGAVSSWRWDQESRPR